MALIELLDEPVHERLWGVGDQLCDLNEEGDLVFPDGTLVPAGHGHTLPKDLGFEMLAGHWRQKLVVGI
jgi:hypothetical protein